MKTPEKLPKTPEKTAKIAKNSRGGLKLYEKLPETLRRRKITSLALFLCVTLHCISKMANGKRLKAKGCKENIFINPSGSEEDVLE